MQATKIRKKLHRYVDESDEKLLKLMYVIAKENNEEDDFEYEFTDEEIKVFEQRKLKRINGESKTYSWKEAKDVVTGKRELE